LQIEVKGHTLQIEGEFDHDRGDRDTAPYTAFVVSDTWLVADGRQRRLRWCPVRNIDLIDQYNQQYR